ncbi:Uncharacterized protein SCF082_LOCUS51962 [Durusdinium trenchii]|uniref:Uncharacterized protein n=2 Tax=Durusdinium trenchii TaxID=1381693 RepID=A0ABP0SI43_9DINO
MSFVAAWPLASFLVRITWRGIPMLMTTLVTPWLTLPLGAFVHDKVNCIDGFDWEVHFAFAFVICMKSMFWLLFYQHEHSAFARVTTYVFYVMAELDMYTDAMFIAIATTCGSWYGHAALLTYAGGVVALQLCIPTLFIGASQGQSGQVGAMWNLLLFPVESAPRTRQKKGYVPLDQQFEINEADAKRQVMVLAVLRCLGEDLPQCVLQYLFTINVKKNPLIMFSIGTSVCSSVFAVAKACYSYNS